MKFSQDDKKSSTNNHTLRLHLSYEKTWCDFAAAPNLKLFPLNNSCCCSKITAHFPVSFLPEFPASYFYLVLVLLLLNGFQVFRMTAGSKPTRAKSPTFDNSIVEFSSGETSTKQKFGLFQIKLNPLESHLTNLIEFIALKIQ